LVDYGIEVRHLRHQVDDRLGGEARHGGGADVLYYPVHEPRPQELGQAGSLDLGLFDEVRIVRVNLWLLIGPWRGVIAHRCTLVCPGPFGEDRGPPITAHYAPTAFG
jgi:hypothetical protein